MGDSRSPRARDAVAMLEQSRIREVANAGFGKTDLLRFWFGESDRATPDYIRQAAVSALEAGRTFYAHNSGSKDLREAIAAYLAALHGTLVATERISVTSSGVSALMVTMQAILSPGDRVVAVTPVWPNLTEIPRILSAQVIRVGLQAGPAGWRLDLDQFLAAVTSSTRLVLINSPGSPTGWTLPAEDRIHILEHCRRLGVWLISDDVYERLVFVPGLQTTPGLLALADPEDRVMGVNSFSKAWLMTGWRLGWITAPSALEADLGKLLEYNTSCAPDFIQAAGLAAIQQGGPYIASLRADLSVRRARLLDRLNAMPGLTAIPPDGGMYVFFKMAGEPDSVGLCRRLLDEAGLGLAPGAAFGPEGEGYLRWCFAVAEDRLEAGIERLEGWLKRS